MGFGASLDFKDLKKGMQYLVISTLIIMPIWFLDLYLFRKIAFDIWPIYMNIVLAYCLTVSSIGITTFFGWLVLDTTKTEHENAFIYGTVIAIFVLLPETLYAYQHKWAFFKFVKYAFIIFTSLYAIRYVTGLPKEFRRQWKERKLFK